MLQEFFGRCKGTLKGITRADTLGKELAEAPFLHKGVLHLYELLQVGFGDLKVPEPKSS